MRILEHGFWLKKRGYREATIRTAIHSLKAIAKNCDLMDTEKVSEIIAIRRVSEGQKEKLCNIYNRFCNQCGLKWILPNYQRVRTLPFVPKQDDLLQLINSLSRRQSAFLQTLMETGARPGEVFQIQWINIDNENNTITINSPEKNSNPRRLRVTKALIAKLSCLTRKSKYVFKQHDDSKFIGFVRYYYKGRLRVANELQNPKLRLISLKSIRHFRASQVYAQTKDLLYTQKILGHRSISSTMVYVHLTDFEEDNAYIVKIASTIEEFTQLLESGFEYVTDFEGRKVLRKRK